MAFCDWVGVDEDEDEFEDTAELTGRALCELLHAGRR